MTIDKTTRTAVLYSGSAYNIKSSLQSQMENLVIPNNADVFVLTERRCNRRRTLHNEVYDGVDGFDPRWPEKSDKITRDETPLSDEELQFIRDTFGDRLKGLYLLDEMPDYQNHLREQRVRMMDIANSYRRYNLENNLPPSFGGYIQEESDGNLRCVVDQFGHVKKCYELMEEYEQQNGFKYDYVVRARIDFIIPEKTDIEEYALNHDVQYLYIMGQTGIDLFGFEWTNEFFWFSKRPIASKLHPALDRMGMIDDRQYHTALVEQNNDFRFAAECQFGCLIKELNLPCIQVKFHRSARFSDGGDGYDYMNYILARDKSNLDDDYRSVCECPTDINEHLPKLREYAEKCKHVTEMGLRWGNSTVAFMAARPEKFISYDCQYNSRIEYLIMMAKENDVNFHFRLDNTETVDIEETDLLFIDTNHHVEQCSVELALHHSKVRKYLIFHDTTTFWEKGQGWEQGHGLRYAIEPFLETHPEWIQDYRAMNNNGLLILKRIA